MTKAELTAKITEATELYQADVEHAIEGLFEQLKLAAERGEQVFIRGFGTFGIVTRKSRPVRDIRNNTSILMPEKKVVKFKPSKEYKAKQ
jgi:nucleoid DNA-binding protein